MKHVVLLFMLCLFTTACLQAQNPNKSNPQPFTGAAAAQELQGPEGSYIHIQIGNGVPFGYAGYEGDTLSVRFPWDVLYIPVTFAEDYFEVSKGYYSDRIQIDWTVQNNANLIDRIVIYRRPYTSNYADDTEGYTTIATLAADAYTFNDTNTQGGKLYEYKVMAVGVSVIEEKYVNYITGVGYRNPTAVVTGNVSFDGGSPVKDVVVRADPQGADLSFGSSLLFANAGRLTFPSETRSLRVTSPCRPGLSYRKTRLHFFFAWPILLPLPTR